MITLEWLVSVAVLPLAGFWALSTPSLRQLHAGLRFAIATCAGIATLTLVMFAETVVGVRWTVISVLVPTLLPSIVALLLLRGRISPSPRWKAARSPMLLLYLPALLLLCLVTMSGGATAFDLLFFWGTKGEKFAIAGAVDTALLANPMNWVMHPDYPPLLPVLYSWTALCTNGLLWFGAVSLTPLCWLLILIAIYGCARAFTPTAELHSILAFGLTLLALLFIDLYIAGDAEPVLLLFEALALGLGTWYAVDSVRYDFVLSIVLSGVALTKVEGVLFVAAFVVALSLRRSRSVREFAMTALRLAGLPAVVLFAWVSFCVRHGLLDAYGGTIYGNFTTKFLTTTIRVLWNQASLGYFYLPWLLILAILALGRFRLNLLTPVVVALVHVPFLIYVYSHGQTDPTGWIIDSAKRVLLTPLLCLLVAAIAAHARNTDRPSDQVPSNGAA